MRYVTLLVAALIAHPAAAADAGFKAMFVRHWQIAKEFTLAVAEAMPADGYDFKQSAPRHQPAHLQDRPFS